MKLIPTELCPSNNVNIPLFTWGMYDPETGEIDDALPPGVVTVDEISLLDVADGNPLDGVAIAPSHLIQEIRKHTKLPIISYWIDDVLLEGRWRPLADRVDIYIDLADGEHLSPLVQDIQKNFGAEGAIVTVWIRQGGDGAWLPHSYEHGDGIFFELPPYKTETKLAAYEDFGWPTPTPIGAITGPAFPVNVLSPALRELVSALAEAVQFPESGVAGFLLALLSACLQGRIDVQPKPDPTYVEPLNLYVLVVAPSSAGKSPILAALLAPLRRAESQMQEEAAMFREVAAARLADLETEIADARQAVAAGDGDDNMLRQLVKQKQAAEAQLQRNGDLIAQEPTPEALARLIAAEGAIALVHDELHLPTLVGTRWGGSVNVTLLLQSYAGSTFSSERVTSGQLRIERPLLAIASGVQPDVVGEFLEAEQVISRGLAGRTYFVFAGDRFGNRTYDTAAIPEAVMAEYESIVAKITRLPIKAQPPRIVFSSEAYELQAQFFEENDREMARRRESDVVSFLGKIVGGAARIAGILHAVKHVDRNLGIGIPLSRATLEAAIEIACFLRAHAEIAYGQIEQRDDVQKVLWERILREKLTEFSANQLFGILKGTKFVKRADDLKGPLAGLVERGFIIPLPVEDREGRPGRRPSPQYVVNPRALRLEREYQP